MFIVEFDPSKVDYGGFVRSVFGLYLEAFDAYRATIREENIVAEDQSEVVRRARATGKDVDGRDGVLRTSAVNYYDGVLLVANSKVLSKEELLKIDGVIRNQFS